MVALHPLIAVVDDEESVRKALKRLLRSFGLDVRTYASGAEFVQSLESQRPDCVVLDVHMHGISGFDVQSLLAARNIPVPIVFITAFDNPGDEARALQAGATVFLRKPIEDRALCDAVDAALRSDSRRAPRA